MSAFRDLEASLVSPKVDKTFGDPTRIVPQRASGEFSRGGADPDRLAYTAIGVVDEVPKIVRGRDMGRDDADAADLAGDKIDISYAVSELGPRERWPRTGDRIDDLSTGKSYVVATAPQDDGIGRVLIKVTRAK